MRAASPADAGELLRLVHAAFAEYDGALTPPSGAHAETVATIRRRLEHGALLAEDGGRAVGCVFYQEQGADLYLNRLAVEPSRRGSGVARQLLEVSFALGARRGLSAATVGVRLQLPDNIGFFAAIGFRPYDLGSHQGFRAPTFLRMRHPLSPAAETPAPRDA